LSLSSRETYKALTGEGLVLCLGRFASVQVTEQVVYKLEKVQSFVCMSCRCILSQWVNGFTIFGHLCMFVCVTACGDLDQKAMIFNMSNRCSLCECFSVLDYLLA